MNELKCNDCGNIQEYKLISKKTKFDKKLNKPVYLVEGKWITFEQTCEKCKSTNLTKDFNTSNLDETSELRNSNSNKYWKNGKTNEHIAGVIAGETDPY